MMKVIAIFLFKKNEFKLFLKFNQFKGILRIYTADHSSIQLKICMDALTSKLISASCESFGLKEDNRLVLCEVKSNGGI
jgi:hypothetical protein